MPARILIIDDNGASLELMTYLLKAFGHEPVGVSVPSSALTTALKGNFDAVISDILMPEVDGFSLAASFKAEPSLRDKPLIAVTALAMPGDRERILGAGFSGYISKPIDPKAFVARVDSFLPEGLRGNHPHR